VQTQKQDLMRRARGAGAASLWVVAWSSLWFAGSAQPATAVELFDPAIAARAAALDDPRAATRAYLDAVPEARRAKTKAYALGNYLLDGIELVYSGLVLVALLATGLSARMRNRARRLVRFGPLQNAFYWVQFLILTALAAFPLTLYRSYFRERAYGLLTQVLPEWLFDQIKGLLVGCLLGALGVMALYGVVRRTPRSWWLWGSGVALLFLILSIAIAPVFIAPLFNKFTPVQDPALKDRILDMAHRHRVPADDVYQMDASRRTDRISAYVSGMLGTTRIVMFDTTLRRCTPAEIQMIVGHEMGHYVLDHVWKHIAFLGILIVLGFLFVRWGFERAIRRWPRMGIEGIADVAGLPLALLLISIFFVVMTPLTRSWIRVHEQDADDFGLMASREPDAAATTFLKLGEYRDLEPHPLVEALLYDHPSGRSRILNAMEWKRDHANE